MFEKDNEYQWWRKLFLLFFNKTTTKWKQCSDFKILANNARQQKWKTKNVTR